MFHKFDLPREKSISFVKNKTKQTNKQTNKIKSNAPPPGVEGSCSDVCDGETMMVPAELYNSLCTQGVVILTPEVWGQVVSARNTVKTSSISITYLHVLQV